REERDRRGPREERDRGADHRGERRPRPPEPALDEDIVASDLDPAVRRELRTLSKDNADTVARHLVATGLALAEGDLVRAREHAEAAGRRAGRIAAVREALGIVYYRDGEWAKALAELRTARRLSGSSHVLPLLADCERGLGRPERALELAQSREAAGLAAEERVELAIVAAGARRDLGQTEAAVLDLRDLLRAQPQPTARLSYAYADALEAAGKGEQAREWFSRALEADPEGETDAEERLALLQPPGQAGGAGP
uniref:tetratricopeptide repeat protein n=1 Tax=Ornithinicoccus halotolerans TaxID=1748220 RepID=UPI001885E3FA